MGMRNSDPDWRGFPFSSRAGVSVSGTRRAETPAHRAERECLVVQRARHNGWRRRTVGSCASPSPESPRAPSRGASPLSRFTPRPQRTYDRRYHVRRRFNKLAGAAVLGWATTTGGAIAVAVGTDPGVVNGIAENVAGGAIAAPIIAMGAWGIQHIWKGQS